MNKLLLNNRGFTLTEILIAAVISLFVVAAILSVWLFTYGSWIGESEHTYLRLDIMKALETIKKDMLLSSLTYASFYPDGASAYTAISIPVAVTDSNGFFSLDDNGKIDWDKTVIYHTYTDGDGVTSLRRTVYQPRDNTMDDDQRYAQLAQVAANGEGGAGSTTDKKFLENIVTFEISSLAPVIDFYIDSSDPVKVGKVIFGWADMDSGEHTFHFEVTGKNDDSSGYDIGIDTIMIEPSGSVREAEYYASSFAPAGALNVNGGTVRRIYDPIWSNDNYLEFDAGGVGDYIEITDSYDLIRESAFEHSALNNLDMMEEEVRIGLQYPEGEEEKNITWIAYAEAEDLSTDGRDGNLPGSVIPPVSIRTVVTQQNIVEEGDMVRVRFKSSLSNQLVISRAYITKRDGTSGANGLDNQDTSGLTPEEYHRHQQLFFEDEATGDITEGVIIPAASQVWSVWSAFPLRKDSDYLITLHISDPNSLDCTYWEGTPGEDRTYYVAGGTYATAGTPDWSGEPVEPALPDIFITTDIDVADVEGTVESEAYDTTLSSPAYGTLKWSESVSSGTNASVKARSSSSEDMSGASDWASVASSAISGTGRYLQFFGELSAKPFWNASGAMLNYENYIDDQVDNYAVYDFPKSSGEPYITQTDPVWIDDVEVDWPGAQTVCAITGYVAKKNNYGQAKLIVDGKELVKILSVHIKTSSEKGGRTFVEENYIEVQPRNTGK